MNTGIGDALNLAWKLAAVLAGRAPEPCSTVSRPNGSRLRPAPRPRPPTASSTSPPPRVRLAEIVRTRIAPYRGCPLAVEALEPARDYLFRTISQITLNYRGEGLADGGPRRRWFTAATACLG